MAKLKTIALTLSGVSALSCAAHAQAASATPNQVGMAMMRLNSAILDQAKSQVFGSGSLWASLSRDFRMNEVNPEIVRSHEAKFAANSAYFDRTINRSKPYMYHIANEVKKRNMPAEIALLPFIESAFVTKAKSHVGASGLWQFMPATGRHYGLEKTALYDGRHDVYAATDAALNYLEYLHGLFGDWSLALAAYNWGEGNVGRAVNRARAQGLEPTYENLRMPNETRNYVPKLLAVRNIVANPQAFGMNVSDISNQPYFKVVDLDKPIDQSAITRLAGISESEFLALNPAFNAPVFVPKYNRKLLLPVSAATTFEKNYRNAKPETLLSWDVYTTYGNTSLSSIAAETGMSVAEIKRLNSISSNTLSAGRSILVAKNSIGSSNPMTNFIDTDNTPDTYRSDMPEMAPIQVAKVSSRQVAVNSSPVLPKNAVQTDFVNLSQNNRAPMPTAADYVATAKTAAIPVQTAKADTPTNLAARNQTTDFVRNTQLATPAVQTAAAKPVEINIASTAVQTPAAESIAQRIENRQAAEKSSISLASGLIQETPSATAAAPQAEAKAAPVDIAISQPLPLPTQSKAVDDSATDSLMSLVEDSTARLNAAETVRATVAQADAREAAAKARAERIAENRAKQQQRAEARLARNSQPAAAPVANGMHRVADGDTLFNIAQRYNLSVADLITANNIRGNNIRTGQVLKVTAAAPNKQSSIRNVSYTVRKGDTLNTIANRFHLDVNDIRRWNQNTRTVTPGQRLKLMGS
ncbi:LysM peptidoglycan-binding domain-containing protein [Neisseria perflava]|uniref:LysM peptidoglycan-binding domain-containing protein n=1 Tax=Neisseria perflava TaxID=33053 RepID=UPI00209D5FBB|nr:LysM peptidoglycan-binding domain-containing protein [Neisseria perflava]MCP1660631.1 membrane-bound lytic murein transglycosylase D [Neisseria perflava]MCP1772369.1 membrane-bound lytic murein transglycosylase D [Neisseria perflava]